MSLPASMGIACVGDNTIDRYVGDESATYVGGNAYNVAAQLAMHGGEVEYFGAIGADPSGELIRSGLVRAGAGTAGLVTALGATAITTIRVDGGERFFEREDFGVTAEYFPDDDEIVRLARASWVHIGMLPRASELRSRLAKERAHRGAGPLVSQDCAVADGYEGLTVAFGSVGADGDARAWAREAVDRGTALAVVTRGASGAVSTDGLQWFEQSALPVQVIDTTGAGDAFIAGFIAARVAGECVAGSMKKGATWAAATCGHRGGWALARVETPIEEGRRSPQPSEMRQHRRSNRRTT